jgi:hypothetical protein
MPLVRAATVSDVAELIRLRALVFGDLGATGW